MTQPTEVQCFTLIKGRRMRMTKLDVCGRPVPGPCSVVVSKGFVTATLSGEIDEGEEIERKNAAGELCVSVPPCPTYKWTNAEITFCEVNPAMATLINPNWKMLTNAAGKGIGYAAGRSFSCEGGFALEIWTDLYGAADLCDDPNATGAWGYLLVPWMANGFMSGDLEIADDAVDFVYSAKSKIGAKWGPGPFDVMLGATGQPGRLNEAVEAWEDYRVQTVDVAPPDAACGCTALVTTATGATAGTPGQFTPTGAPPPDDLADLQASSIVASPVTAWGPGTYVVLGDATHAFWDGNSYEVGQAP
jgi:hypothetical protein